MAINSQSLSTIQNKVTGLTTNETDFRSGLSDTLIQVDADQIKLAICTAGDLEKLNDVTATAAELNVLDGITASTANLNVLNGITATTQELNLLDGVTATTTEMNRLDGLTATTAELNRLSGSGITTADLQKLSAVSASAAELNVLDGFTGNAADLNRTVQLDAMGNGTAGQVMTSDGDGTYSWTTPNSFTWILEDGDGTEVAISTQEVKFVEGNGIDIDWTDTSNGTDADPFDLTFTNTDRGSSQNIFKNIQINGATSFSANSNTENLNFKAGTGLTVVGADGDNSVTYGVTSNSIGATQLSVSGNGTTSQFLRSDGDGTFTWATPPDTNTTYNAGTNLSLSSGIFSVVASPSFTNVSASGTVTAGGFSTSGTVSAGTVSAGGFSTSGTVSAGTVSAGTVNATNVNVSGTLVETSDERLKENIEPITEALTLVNKLNGVYFNKIDTPDKLEIGFIAQDVEEIIPELVEEAGNYKAVSYARTVAVLVEAVKELSKQVEALQNKG